MKKFFKKMAEVIIIAFVTTSLTAVAASYRSITDTPSLLVKYVDGIITDLTDSRGNAVGLVTSTNNASVNTIKLTNGAMLCNSTAPTITSGFGASAVVASSNGSCTFQINVGATSVAASGVLAMPAATTGWNCFVQPVGTSLPVNTAAAITTSTSTSVTVSNFNDDTGAALNWGTSEVLAFSCSGY